MPKMKAEFEYSAVARSRDSYGRRLGTRAPRNWQAMAAIIYLPSPLTLSPYFPTNYA